MTPASFSADDPIARPITGAMRSEPSAALVGARVSGIVRAALVLVNGAALAASALLLGMLLFMLMMLSMAPPAPVERRWEWHLVWALSVTVLAFWRVFRQLRRHGRWPWAFQLLALAAAAAVWTVYAVPPRGM